MTPVGGAVAPVGGAVAPVGGAATPARAAATPVGGVATPVGGAATVWYLGRHRRRLRKTSLEKVGRRYLRGDDIVGETWQEKTVGRISIIVATLVWHLHRRRRHRRRCR